jgi:Arc/MetJ-type ribon-helix-helix transcriptional regulator
MSVRRTRLTITVDSHLSAYAEHLVETGKASSVSAVINDALSAKKRHDRRAMDRLKEIAAQADPDQVARMLANIDAQAARLPEG